MFAKYIFLSLLTLLFQGFFYCENIAVADEQGTVNVNALVPAGEISPGPSPSGGGAVLIFDTQAPQISNVNITEITVSSALISWNTNENSSAYIYYGKTLSYEIGSLQTHSENLVSSHEIKLENLQANKFYYFQVRSLDSVGNQSIKDGFQFRTLAERKNVANVSNFQAVEGDSLVSLSWQNPLIADFQAVKIFRSEIFYPKGFEDGALIYNGKENFFIDKNLINDIVYYYTIFVYDANDNYSSGAVAKATPQKFGLPTSFPAVTPILFPAVTPIFSPILTPIILPSPKISSIKLEDFDFDQGAGNLKIIDGKIEVELGKVLTVSIDAQKVPEAVGMMMLILAQDGEPQSFLFKIESEKNKYSVSFAPPAFGGVYSLTNAFLDKNNNPIQAISGNLIVKVGEKPAEEVPWYIDLLWIFLIIFIILVARMAWKLVKKALVKNKKKIK